jgi:hypothetical protein
MTDPTMHPSGAPEPSRVPTPAEPTEPTQRGSPPPPIHRERRRRAVGWQSKDILRTAALIVGIYLALHLLWVARELFFGVFLGALFGLAVASAAAESILLPLAGAFPVAVESLSPLPSTRPSSPP